MNKTDPPTSFGIFKPVGHTLITFHTESELQTAQSALAALGFGPSSMVHYSASEMGVQIDAELLAASPLANFGYELDLIRVHKGFADDGCCFLVVDAPTEALRTKVADFVRAFNPASAQHYGRFMIEDLTEKAPGRMGEIEAQMQ